MSADARTTFVIASRNRVGELSSVVRRLLDTGQCPIVVVDNASEDNTITAMKRLQAHAEGRLSVISLAVNRGAAGRNIGVAYCDTEYVAFCDDDSWWGPGSIAVAEELLNRHGDVALLAARTIMLPSGREDPIVASLRNSTLGRPPELPGPLVQGFLACSAIVRKSAFMSVGGFSPILHFRGEEQLLAWDLMSRGWFVCFCEQLTTYHRPSIVRPATVQQHARELRNDALSAWLRRPYRHCAWQGLRLLGAATRGNAYRAALREALGLLPAVVANRRPLPENIEKTLAAAQGD